MKLLELKETLLKHNIELNDGQLEQFDKYAKFLKEYNEKINLTAITDYEEIIEKHFYDSIICSTYKKLEGTLVDVGTGAGFPGVVLKITYPNLKVTLLEPLNKRCVFLNELIKLLNLKDIEVINVRGEDHSLKNREKYDYVTARAVTNLNGLIEICGAMVKVGGYFIALRGKDGLIEIEGAKGAIKTMGFEIEETHTDLLSDEATRITSFFKKVEKTKKSFPRKYSTIKKEPLCQK